MTTTIEYYRKSVYGNELMYVSDPQLANTLTRLIGTVSINQEQMSLMTSLFGTEWKEVIAPRAA